LFDAGSLYKIRIEGKSTNDSMKKLSVICQKIADYFLKNYRITIERVSEEDYKMKEWIFDDWKLKSKTTVGYMTCPHRYSSANFIIQMQDISAFK